MNVKGGLAVAAVAACLLTACSGSASTTGSESSIPRTPANVAVCKVLEEVLAGTARVQQLAISVLETNAPISHGLRHDLAQYAVSAASAGARAAQRAEAKAKQDCRAITGS
jgi:hypothetical protein